MYSLERRYSDYDTPTQESVNYGREFLPIQRETPTDSLDGFVDLCTSELHNYFIKIMQITIKGIAYKYRT